MKADKIVIVGGGSAGWMTAATLTKAFPNKEIVLVESANIPVVGVGESTLGHINRWMKFIGIEDKDFMPDTNASYKMSIKFTDFSKEGVSFHYPFGSAQDSGFDIFYAWHNMRSYYPDTPVTDYVDTFFSSSALFNQNKYSDKFPNLDNDYDVAYHFDAIAFGQWLKENKCEGVERIEADVTGVRTDLEGYITELQTSVGDITGDLFVDCTGFKALLLDKFMEEPFINYEHMLPNNKAWACAVPYQDKEKELEPFTNCTAIENGWCWNIPLWSRLGTGYVYSDRFVSDEEALEQFKNYLMSDKMVVPRTREQVDALEYRPISMRVGIHERPFVKNVVGIGLALGFLEPLESNGLLTVHESLFWLLDILNRDVVSEFDKTLFNERVRSFFDEFARFLFLHYSMSQRSDTPYWKDVHDRVIENPSFYNQFMEEWTISPNEGIAFISTGMDYKFVNPWRAQHTQGKIPDGSEQAQRNRDSWNEMKYRWAEFARVAPSLYDYLKENIHVR